MLKALEKIKWLEDIFVTRKEEQHFEVSDVIKNAFSEAIIELEALETKDRLAELEKVILDYYLAKGYQVGVGGWHFATRITTHYKNKIIEVHFRKNKDSEMKKFIRLSSTTTKEMFDKAFEYFTIKAEE
ncbi:hypothetical protein [Aliarcobacter butzleri]|uniref:hypothetical protein n=1 Tax=Aliarcobacter butzleri TaxID=28197 RepID=UPI001EDAC12D|nr:hypothetical protein [Aliarcobacter butzleri]MCG3683686.1 hypothetical protein [Aliarcobacter butzleri]